MNAVSQNRAWEKFALNACRHLKNWNPFPKMASLFPEHEDNYTKGSNKLPPYSNKRQKFNFCLSAAPNRMDANITVFRPILQPLPGDEGNSGYCLQGEPLTPDLYVRVCLSACLSECLSVCLVGWIYRWMDGRRVKLWREWMVDGWTEMDMRITTRKRKKLKACIVKANEWRSDADKWKRTN